MRQLLYYFIHKQPRARLFNTQQVVGLVYNLTRCSSTISFWNQANIHVFSFQYPCNLWRQLVQYISIASFLRQVLILFFFYFFKYIYPYTLIPTYTYKTMVLYDEIDLEDMSFDSESNTFFYPCPCGDQFQVSVDKLMDDSADMHIAACPNCGLEVSVRFEPVSNSFFIRQLEGGPIKFLVILISFFIIYRTIYTNLPVDSRKLSRFLRRFTSRPFPIASLSRSESPYLA